MVTAYQLAFGPSPTQLSALVARTSRGLGLAFCRLAVVAHGGAIWVEDGQPGVVFCVRLPDGS